MSKKQKSQKRKKKLPFGAKVPPECRESEWLRQKYINASSFQVIICGTINAINNDDSALVFNLQYDPQIVVSGDFNSTLF